MKIVSLFSGAGGLDLGLIQAEHVIVWANDIYKDAVETYRRNIGSHILLEDIRRVPSSEIPNCDVIVGGFPCQGFSIANWTRRVDDPRNQLYRELLRVVRDKQPNYFIAENVKGLLSLGKGIVLEYIVRDFEALGYRVYRQVLNAADYGVPQRRMRLFIVGEKRSKVPRLQFPPKQTHVDPLYANGRGLHPWLSVGEALSHFPEPENGTAIPNHTCSKYKLRFNGHIGHRFIDPNKPAPTVTARGDERGGVVVLHHPSNLRRMTARELAAVQGFPDSFVFVGTQTSAYRQIGNAVPPPVGKAIGLMLNEAEVRESTE